MPLPELVSSASTVVWDFDGVVADTEPVQAAAYNAVLARYGVEQPPDWFHTWVGTPEPAIWAGLRAALGLAAPVEVLCAERAEVYSELARSLRPAWFVAPTLALRCPHRIVSAGNRHQIELLLDSWGIRDAFASLSATGAPGGDPCPKAERLAAALTPGAVLFEDSARYLAAAGGHLRVGVHHRFNDPANLACDVLVAHGEVGVWHVR